jgi:queuine/archaeosine tRNA-ribosyltransferase
LQNACEFITLYQKGSYKFTPIGVAQGDTPEAYASSVKKLLDMGYTYIAIGGLSRSNAAEILNVLKATSRIVEESKSCSSEEIRFHLFGVAKLTLMNELPKYGVVSIDSASYLRKAWLQSGRNYFGADGQWYTAIRVPQSYNPKVLKYVENNGKCLKEVESQERICLEKLQLYNDRKLKDTEFEALLDAIVEYDTYLLRSGDDGIKIRDKDISREKYRRTLEARPWENCSCKICQSLGIHTLIFRGTNRNKRRGFHNTWSFYQRLKSITCTQA